MWLPRWLRTLARRKSGEEANAESARQLNNYFAPGGIVQGPVEGYGSDSVPYVFGEGGCHGGLLKTQPDPRDVAVEEIMGMLKPPLRSEVQSIIARVYAAGYANREEGSQ
jgi:hypothetical protein